MKLNVKLGKVEIKSHNKDLIAGSGIISGLSHLLQLSIFTHWKKKLLSFVPKLDKMMKIVNYWYINNFLRILTYKIIISMRYTEF